jgi:hypothetical protein
MRGAPQSGFSRLMRRNRPRAVSIIEGDPKTPLLSPNDMAVAGDGVRSYRQHKSVREPQRDPDFDGRPSRRNVANDAVDFSPAEFNSSGLQLQTSRPHSTRAFRFCHLDLASGPLNRPSAKTGKRPGHTRPVAALNAARGTGPFHTHWSPLIFGVVPFGWNLEAVPEVLDL